MKTVLMERPENPTPNDLELISFLDVVEKHKDEGKIYQTDVWCMDEKGDNERFSIVTTSKDLHLELGRLRPLGRDCFVRFLESCFSSSPGETHVHLSKKEGRGVLAVRTLDDGVITFTVSHSN